MKLLICGGREFTDRERLQACIEAIQRRKGIETVIHGAARGADRLAGTICSDLGIDVQAVPADWNTHGKAAGSIRNRHMLEMEPDGVLAMPGGSGTAHMCRIAEAAGVPVWRPLG